MLILQYTLCPKKILEAYDKSDFLVVEANIFNQAEDLAYLQSKMFFEGDETLEKSVPKEVYDRFVEVIKPLNLDPAVYNKFKPWYAAMFIQGTQLTQSSVSANVGIDMYFLSKAFGKKEIKEIEGLKFQVDMFESFSNEIQVWFLASALESVSDVQQQDAKSQQQDASAQQQVNNVVAELLSSWKKGDPSVVEKILALEESAAGAEAKEFNRVFWTARNNNMFEKTKEFLADPEKNTYFIVVGAGHMGGDSGIIKKLIEAGYKVEQIK